MTAHVSPPVQQPPVDRPRQALVEQIMGMPVSVHLRGPGARSPEAAEAVRQAFEVLREVDHVFSLWRPDTVLSRVQRGETPVAAAGADVAEVFALCEQARRWTGGWFDHERLDGDGLRTVDPTGLVKGWAVERALDRVVTTLGGSGLTDVDVSVNAGGDVAVQLGTSDADAWVVGIENPFDRTRLVAAVPLRAGGAATSGAAARGGHVTDPFTGAGVDRAGSVTVYGPSLMWADVLATAAFAHGSGSAAWLAALPGRRSAGYGAIVVEPDGRLVRIDPAAQVAWGTCHGGSASPTSVAVAGRSPGPVARAA